MKKEIPFVAFGNEELAGNPKVGKTAKCPKCSKQHKVKYGTNTKTGKEFKLLAFVSCGKKTYLVGVNQKTI